MEKEAGQDFRLIVYGDVAQSLDFFVFPYNEVSWLFTEDTLTNTSSKGERWMGSLAGGYLSIHKAEAKVDCRVYQGNKIALDEALRVARR